MTGPVHSVAYCEGQIRLAKSSITTTEILLARRRATLKRAQNAVRSLGKLLVATLADRLHWEGELDKSRRFGTRPYKGKRAKAVS